MFSDPYYKIPTRVRDVIEDLIRPEDEYHQVHKRRLARTLQIFLNQKPEGKVLELGTEGFFPLALSELAPDLEITVTNFDFSQEEKHTYTASMSNKTKKFPAFAIDLESNSIPEESKTFDWVICCEVIEHMDVDPMFMMSEVNRVTVDGGGLLLTTPNITSSRAIEKFLRGIEPYFFMQYHKDRSPYRHNYEYSVTSLKAVIKAAGFRGKVWTEDTFEDPVMSGVDKLSSIGVKIEHTGDNIFALANKSSKVLDRHPREIYV